KHLTDEPPGYPGGLNQAKARIQHLLNSQLFELTTTTQTHNYSNSQLPNSFSINRHAQRILTQTSNNVSISEPILHTAVKM
ncbi:MAG: hypothetical protein P8176_12060, partial [Gammaproteobacteria bacterium]